MDQAETKYKKLNSLRQSIDRCEEGEIDSVMVVGVSSNISKKMDDWMKKICVHKDRNKKL